MKIKTPPPISRQRQAQIRNAAAGMCGRCGTGPAMSGGLCPTCLDAQRLYQRRYYRQRHGIPLDAPLRSAASK